MLPATAIGHTAKALLRSANCTLVDAAGALSAAISSRAADPSWVSAPQPAGVDLQADS
jgi:hypothetical protein